MSKREAGAGQPPKASYETGRAGRSGQSGSWPSAESFARDGDAEGLRHLLDRRGDAMTRSELSSGFKRACEAGSVECARALAPRVSGDADAVSRGVRRAAWGGHVECMRFAMSLVEGPGWINPLDVALGLRDVDFACPGGRACAAELLRRPAPEAQAWALRERMGSGGWGGALELLEACAPEAWEAEPLWSHFGDALSYRALSGEEGCGTPNPSPKAYWRVAGPREAARRPAPRARTRRSARPGSSGATPSAARPSARTGGVRPGRRRWIRPGRPLGSDPGDGAWGPLAAEGLKFLNILLNQGFGHVWNVLMYNGYPGGNEGNEHGSA